MTVAAEAPVAEVDSLVDSPVVELLKLAQAALSWGWCQDNIAEDEDGEPVLPWDESAAYFCALGSLQRAYAQKYGVVNKSQEDILVFRAAVKRLDLLCVRKWGEDLIGYNDEEGRAKQEVVDVFELAIREEQAA
jgi:hypothetical protein